MESGGFGKWFFGIVGGILTGVGIWWITTQSPWAKPSSPTPTAAAVPGGGSGHTEPTPTTAIPTRPANPNPTTAPAPIPTTAPTSPPASNESCKLTYAPSGIDPRTAATFVLKGNAGKDAKVYLNGKCQGTIGSIGPFLQVPAGRYDLKVSQLGYQDFLQSADIQGQQFFTVDVTMHT
jgi:hypothetical protein